jgi:hypothetical protein
MSVTNFRRASFKKGLPKTSKFADIPAPIPTPSIVTAGLVRWYDAGNTSSYPGTGTTWTDLQGSGYNLTLQNGPTFTSSGVGSYFTFDGSNDYAEGPDTGLPATNTARTYVFWSYRAASTDFLQTWFYGTAAGGQGVYLYQMLGYSPNLGAGLDTYGGVVGGYVQSYPLNAWSMLAFTYAGGAGGAYAYYLNGSSVNTGTTSAFNTTLAGSTGLNLAKSAPFGSGYFNGRIAQWYMYNTALSSGDILNNFNAQKAAYGL